MLSHFLKIHLHKFYFLVCNLPSPNPHLIIYIQKGAIQFKFEGLTDLFFKNRHIYEALWY